MNQAAVVKNSIGIGRAIDVLARRFGDRLSTAKGALRQHANITTWHPAQFPDGVVYPESTEEVAEIVVVCADHRVPIIPFGVGTSLEGGVNAPLAESRSIWAACLRSSPCTKRTWMSSRRLG
jgi:D-lactate dehydrogenase (cytochrome)